ncbi:hypothetical protein FO519_009333 [Halicephalobus sp. NKZ332]|nr:hypothetical protein FO519_009333 [Halicephalobus sp. NKZ332]
MTTWHYMDRNDPDFYGTPYIMKDGKKEKVSIRTALRDLKFRGNSGGLDRIVIPRQIESSILENGNIVIGQSPDSQYLGCVRQIVENNTYCITNVLIRFVPGFSSLSLPPMKANSVLQRVAFCMSPRSQLTTFMNNYENSINFRIYSLLHDICISLRMKSSDSYHMPSLRYMCSTENQIFLSFPISKPNMMSPLHIFLMPEIPENLVDGKDRTVMRIHGSYVTGSAASLRFTRHEALSVYKNGEFLKFFQTRQGTDAELFLVTHTPDVPSAIYGALMKQNPQFARIEFDHCLGGIKKFSDIMSFYDVYASFFFQEKEYFVFSSVTVPSPLAQTKEIQVKIHWIKASGDIAVRKMIHRHLRNKITPDFAAFGSSFYYANLNADKSVTSIMPKQSGKLMLDNLAKRTVWILFLANLLNYMDRFTIAGVLTDVMKDFHLDSAEAGLLQTVFIVTYMIAAPVFGYLGDRYSRKSIMICGLTIWSFAVLACTFVPSSWPYLFFTLRGVVGIGEASYAIIAPSIIADMFTDTERSMMLMFFYIATPVGSGCGYAVGSTITSFTSSWRWGLRITPIFGLIVLFLIFKYLKEPTRGQVDYAQFEPTTLKEDLLYISKMQTFWLCTIGFTFGVFVIGALSWWTPTVAEYAYGAIHGTTDIPSFVQANISLTFGVITCLAGLSGVVIGSNISKYCSKKLDHEAAVQANPVICGSGVLISTPLMFLSLVFTVTSMNLGWVLIFIAVTCMCINWAVNVDIIMSVVVPPRRAMASAIQTLVSHLFGDAVSPYVVGLIADKIRGQGLTPDALTQYTALEYALFLPNFFLVLSGAAYLLSSFYISEDLSNCNSEIHRRQFLPEDNDTENESVNDIPVHAVEDVSGSPDDSGARSRRLSED